MNELMIINLERALTIITPAVISLLAAIIAMYINNLRRKVQEQNGIAALEIFDKTVEQIVKALNQTEVRHIKRRGIGSLSPDDIKYIKGKAVKEINILLDKKTKKDIKYIVGNLDSYVDAAIESKVKDQKEENKK